MVLVKPQIVVHIQPQAAPKPAPGAPCNGCGICCLSEPCPLGILLSRRRHGACVALRWDDATCQYRCGSLSDAAGVLQQALPRALHWLAPVGRVLLARLGRRWIAAGIGCDSTLEVQGPPAGSDRQSPP